MYRQTLNQAIRENTVAERGDNDQIKSGFTAEDAGLYFSAERGEWEMECAVMAFALSHGWDGRFPPSQHSASRLYLFAEAEGHMNSQLCPEGYLFGLNESGWGLWKWDTFYK